MEIRRLPSSPCRVTLDRQFAPSRERSYPAADVLTAADLSGLAGGLPERRPDASTGVAFLSGLPQLTHAATVGLSPDRLSSRRMRSGRSHPSVRPSFESLERDR